MTKTISLTILLATAFLAAPLGAAPAAPPAPYHLVLEAHPAAPFPYLAKFGTVELHVYRGGVKADVLWLNAFSRNGAPDVTVTNPLGRMYVEVPVRDIASIVRGMAGAAERIEQISTPISVETIDGKVRGLPAKRHRIVYGPAAFIDYWASTQIPGNPQLRAITYELLRGISPATAETAKAIPGAPLYVELNFRRFKKVPLLTFEKLTMAADDEADALERGSLYMRAGVLEKLWTK